ncbi:MarR family transcriptional regulator [Corynebacterium kroppenstedtii]|nr:MarR family transcriptional regulator [Corynebacterium kroppenstedtii]
MAHTRGTSARSLFAVHARFRGRTLRRAEYVKNSAQAMEHLPGVLKSTVEGVEDISLLTRDAESEAQVVMAFLSAGEWAIGIGIGGHDPSVVARSCTGKRAGTVGASIATISQNSSIASSELASDISAAFSLIGHVLTRRTEEGREATALMRQGYTQNDAAAELGISKQAMSQRLVAAGWQAEQAGWDLAVHLLTRAEEL